MRIFITGHNGFIGQHLCQKLSNHTLGFLAADIRQHDLVKKELNDFDPHIIVHLAARTEVEQSFTEQITFSDINYVGTVNLIESARALPNLKNFVFASTMEVYGWQPVSDLIKDNQPFQLVAYDEDTPPNPNAPYAVAKYACEKYLEYALRSYGLPYTILRQSNSYGRSDNDFFVTERIITQMLSNPNEIFLGDPIPWRNFIFIDDLVDAWITVIENYSRCIGDVFCVGPDNAIKIGEYAQLIADKLQWHGKINWYSRGRRPGEIYLLNSTNKKITNKLGWEPKISLNEGLDRTIKLWRPKYL